MLRHGLDPSEETKTVSLAAQCSEDRGDPLLTLSVLFTIFTSVIIDSEQLNQLCY